MGRANWTREPLFIEQHIDRVYYYDAEARTRIRNAFRPRQGFDDEKFFERLEGFADHFLEMSRGIRLFSRPPSLDERYWSGLSKKIEAVRLTFQEMERPLRSSFDHFADRIAKADGRLPDFEPERIALDPPEGVADYPETFISVWPAHQQVAHCLKRLDWLGRVAQEAKAFAAGAKGYGSASGEPKGGNRPDEALHMFYRLAEQLLTEASVKAPTAYLERVYGKPKGTLVDFMAACLKPLGYRGSRRAIYDTIMRVREQDGFRRTRRRRDVRERGTKRSTGAKEKDA